MQFHELLGNVAKEINTTSRFSLVYVYFTDFRNLEFAENVQSTSGNLAKCHSLAAVAPNNTWPAGSRSLSGKRVAKSEGPGRSVKVCLCDTEG